MARVLVVDDAAFMRKVVSDALAAGGHEVVGEGANGVEAVARFQELRPDLTMLDLTMPEKTGLEALKLGAKKPSGQAVQARAVAGGGGQGPRLSARSGLELVPAVKEPGAPGHRECGQRGGDAQGDADRDVAGAQKAVTHGLHEVENGVGVRDLPPR